MAKATKPAKVKPAKVKAAGKAKKKPGVKKKIAKKKAALPLPGGLKLKGGEKLTKVSGGKASKYEPPFSLPYCAIQMIHADLFMG